MKRRITRVAALAGASLMLSACSSVTLWPFGRDKEQDTSRPPPGATAYTCDGGQRLFVRYLDNGAAAWVILPGREFRLNKVASASGTSYGNGNATLDIKDNGVTLFDGAKATHAGCKVAGG
jgi:membrane-bound inhibitor of C-type lysozyme